MIPDAKLGWMAGILDYHGLLIRKKNRTRATPQLVLMVESTKTSVVRELGRLTGSHAESRHNRLVKDWMQRGCTEHCPEPHIEHEAPGPSFLPPVTRWTVTGAAMAVVLHNVIPCRHGGGPGQRGHVRAGRRRGALVGEAHGGAGLGDPA